MGRWTFDRPLVVDLTVACLLTVPTVAATVVADGVSRHAAPIGWPGYMLGAAAALALAPRRRLPLTTLAVVALCTSAYLAAGYAYGPILIVFMLAVYGATRHAPPRPALWCAAAALGLMLVHLFTSDRPLGPLGIGPVAAWVVVPATIGYGLRLRHEAARRARAETIRRRVDDERLRVAREVHDIVGHGLAAIKMQADIALHVMARRPEHAQVALSAISHTSQQALDELRGTLAAVRTPPRFRDGLEQLSRRMADAGIDVRLDIAAGATDRPMPAAVDLAAYRVVQESLTNVLRHGGCAQADVTVRHDAGGITITVANPRPGPAGSGTGTGTGTGTGAGSGIAGMRARVEALGGQLTAGPVAERFEIRARLPIGNAP
jgi:signal transduction histidine kinase